MVPINEVLIAKIVLGYLSSRNLSGTADYFVKECEGFQSSTEPGMCEKERILNHLEGLNLLPSLEDILKDYFAYQGPDEVASDKVYMLWKQLDVVIGQLRAITMGKSKAKAFMNSRRAPRTFNKLVSKNENMNQPDANQFTVNETNGFNKQVLGLQNTEEAQANEMEKLATSLLPGNISVNTTQTAVLTTPVKETVKRDKREFRSPRRKPRHPRHVTTSTEELVKCSTSEVVSDAPLNKEFSDLVAALISNDKLSVKLADNINKVVSVETKPPSKFDDIDEIIKLTADDPDLNILFSMLSGPHPHPTEDTPQPVNQHFDINTAIASTGLNVETPTLSNYIELQPIVTSASNTQIEVVNSNIQPTHMESVDKGNASTGDVSLQPYLMHDPSMTNFLGMLDPYNSDYPCMRDLNPEFSEYPNKMETSYEPLQVSEAVKSMPETQVKVTSVTSKIDDQLSLPQGSLTSPQLLSTTTLPACGEVKADNTEKKNVDDNVILASHALLQLSTSPMKLSTTSTVENVISTPIFSPQALASNRKTSRELICSTNYTMPESTVNLNDITNDIVPQNDQFVSPQNIPSSSGPPYSNNICTQPNSVVTDVTNMDRKIARKKPKKIKKSSTVDPGENISGSPGENEDTINKKPKRGKEITVTQLDFSPAVPSTPIHRLNQTRNKVDDNNVVDNNVVDNNSSIHEGAVDIDISSNMVEDHNTTSSSSTTVLPTPLNSINKQSNVESKANIICKNGSISVSSPKLKPAVSEEEAHNCSVVKPTSDQFQTFRITGNAISKVVSLDQNEKYVSPTKTCGEISDGTISCKSKIRAISMVINNTNSLNSLNMSPNKLQMGFDPPENKCIEGNTCSPRMTPTASSSYTNIRRNCFMPGETSKYLDVGLPSDTISIGKENRQCVTSKSKLNTDYCGSNLNKKENRNNTTSNVGTVNPLLKLSHSMPLSFIKNQDGDQVVGTNPLEKLKKENTAASSIGKISKKKEKSFRTKSIKNATQVSKKMTVKFNFKKSPTKRKQFISKVGSAISADVMKKQTVDGAHSCETSSHTHETVSQKEESNSCKDEVDIVMSKIEPLSCPDATDVSNQETIRTQSFLECLKTSCNIAVTSSSTCSNNNLSGGGESDVITNTDASGTCTPDTTSTNSSIIDITTIDNDSMHNITTVVPTHTIVKMDSQAIDILACDAPLSNILKKDIQKSDNPTTDILKSDIPASEISTNDILPNNVLPNNVLPNDIPVCEVPTTGVQVTSTLPQPLPIMSEHNSLLNTDIQATGKVTKRKAKRKRNLSLLMLNVDNVAQLLSGIDYS